MFRKPPEANVIKIDHEKVTNGRREWMLSEYHKIKNIEPANKENELTLVGDKLEQEIQKQMIELLDAQKTPKTQSNHRPSKR